MLRILKLVWNISLFSLNCELQCAHYDVLQSPNKLKNYKLRWLSKPLRLTKFEFFWIQVYSIVAVLGYQALFFYFLWVLDSVFSMILLWFSIAEKRKKWIPNVGCFPPFYSVILGFGVPLILPPWPPRYQSLYYASHFDGWLFPYFS